MKEKKIYSQCLQGYPEVENIRGWCRQFVSNTDQKKQNFRRLGMGVKPPPPARDTPECL